MAAYILSPVVFGACAVAVQEGIHYFRDKYKYRKWLAERVTGKIKARLESNKHSPDVFVSHLTDTMHERVVLKEEDYWVVLRESGPLEHMLPQAESMACEIQNDQQQEEPPKESRSLAMERVELCVTCARVNPTTPQFFQCHGVAKIGNKTEIVYADTSIPELPYFRSIFFRPAPWR